MYLKKTGLFCIFFFVLALKCMAIDTYSETVYASMNLDRPDVPESTYIQPLQQGITITGIVSDKGEPLPGVNVTVKGTTTGIMTGADGRYSLTVPDRNTVLVFSYIGYVTREITVGNQTSLNVTMEEDVLAIEEVVVVGYGTVRKSDVTGAVSRVTESTIKERPVQNALQAMQGKATGVDITSNFRPGETGSIRIRGNRSISASNEPLYVIDGIPLVSGNITDINPNDIGSIEILKDASATAIYGSRAANGVVLVSTKKGTKGRSTVNYDGTVTFTNIHSLTDWMNSGELLNWQRQRHLNGGDYAGRYGTAPDPARDFSLYMGNLAYMKRILATAYQLNNDALGAPDPNNPVLRAATAEEKARGYADQIPVYDASKLHDSNWADLILRTGITQNHQVSLSSGSDNSKLYFSVAYLDQKSPMKDQEYDRYTLNFSGEITPQKWLTVGVMGNLSRSNQDYGMQNTNNTGPKDSYGQALNMSPYAPAYDENGKLLVPATSDNFSYRNVLNNIKNCYYEILQYTMMANIFADVKFTPWLRYRVNYGSQYRNTRTGNYYSDDFKNPWGSAAASAPGTGYFVQPTSYSWLVENLLYLDKTFGDHTIGVTLLQSAQKTHTETINIRSQNLTFPSSKWYSLQNNANSTPFGYGTGASENQLMSYMARFNYSLKNKYLLTATGRWDGSSVLAPGNKWDFFPSSVIAWKMEQEEFMKDINWINQMKLRLGYGVTGNSAVSAYSTGGSIASATYIFGDKTASSGYRLSGMPNNSLSWEKTAQWNVGLDYSVLQSRLSGSIEFYQSNTSDLILSRTLPIYTGFSTIRANVGKTRNTGLEITISSRNITRPDFQWTTDITWSSNKEKIIELANGKEDMVSNGWFIGHPVEVWRDYEYDRLWQDTPEDRRLMEIYNKISNYNYRPGQTKLVDQQPLVENSSMEGQSGWRTITLASGEKITFEENGFGQIGELDMKILGTSRPKWIGGLTNTFTYKNLELNFFVYMRVGNMYYGTLQTFGRRVEKSVWSPENPNAKFYQPTTTPNLTDHSAARNLADGSMVAVRNISLSYTLPSNLTKKVNAQRAQVYAQVLNPFIFGGEIVRLGINPDDENGWRTSSTSGGFGGQSNNTILMRSFVLGLRVGF